MKKFVISLLIVIGIIILNKDNIIIPKDSIRIRIIPNSNSEYDQKIKRKVKKVINSNLGNIVGDAKDIAQARKNIISNIDRVDDIVFSELKDNNYDLSYSINYGLNSFPDKEYKGVKYEEGNYESLVITLGEGMGDNWWCVLFPPFCLVEAEENDEVEYKFKILEVIQRYF